MEDKKESLKVKNLHDLFLNETRYIIKAEWFFSTGIHGIPSQNTLPVIVTLKL